MIDKGAKKWDESAKSGIFISLFKKDDGESVNIYKGVCLLSICSRKLGKFIT